MSWFKKLFSQGDEDSSEYDASEMGISSVTNQEVHTKMKYQHVDGKFQFPFIPDAQKKQEAPKQTETEPIQPIRFGKEEQPKLEVVQPISNRRLEEQSNSAEKYEPSFLRRDRRMDQGNSSPSVGAQNKITPITQSKQEKKIVSVEPKKLDQSGIRRSFTPSRVPSPVFGFQTPKQLTELTIAEVIEFELVTTEFNRYIPKQRLEREVSVLEIEETINNEHQIKTSMLTEEVASASELINEEITKGIYTHTVEMHNPTFGAVNIFGYPDQNSWIQIDKEEETFLENESLLEKKSLEDEEQTKVFEEFLSQPEEQLSGSGNLQASIKPILSWAEQAENELIEQPLEEINVIPKDEQSNEKTVHTSENLEVEEPKLIFNNNSTEEVNPSFNENEFVEEKQEIPKNIARERPTLQQKINRIDKEAVRNLPINVMMLRSDRKKLEIKKEQQSIANEVDYELQPVVDKLRPEEVVHVEVDKPEQEGTLHLEITESDHEEVVQIDINQREQYEFPPISFLQEIPEQAEEDDGVEEQQILLNETFQNFNVGASVVYVTKGPTVTRFEVQPEPGVKVNRITNLSDDIKLSLSARDIRIEAPIPGKNTIGIEVPNKKSRPVFVREIIEHPVFKENQSPLTVALGLDISGTPIVTDLRKMPHGLIAGSTGSGKSVCINTMLISLLYKAAPHEVKLILIDPKVVELQPYNHIPHLVSPVITDAKAATGALKWAVEEMERRYELFAHTGVRDIGRFNELAKKHQKPEQHMPYIVIIIDELADLMMVAPGDVEEYICRIAQKARACGIHLIVATQRPSVDVITGLIKANIPTRIAFSVSSQIDSRTIIDTSGAERLLGRGDMLFLENGTSKAVRLQGNFVSDDEIESVVDFVKQQLPPSYLFNQEELLKASSAVGSDGDELFYEACDFAVQQGSASTSSVQRRFRIGYNRAARLIDMMEEQGIISGATGSSKPREVLVTEMELANLREG